MSVRLKDIAQKTGYSVATVSRALHHNSQKYKISQATINKIQAVADELGYRANKVARSLKSKKSQEVGVVVPDILNPFFAKLTKSINKEIRNVGFTMMLCDSDELTEIEKKSLDHLLERRVAGLIIAPVGIIYDHIQLLKNTNTPTVIVDRIFQNLAYDTVCVDNYKGGYLVTEHLIKEGHRKIAFIQGLPQTTTNENRLRGYTEALKIYRIPINSQYILGDDFRILNGYLQTKTLLKLNDPPTAIFAAGDLIALGAIQAVKEENMEIPRDVSVVTFDDPSYFAHLSPPLTAVKQPVTDMGIIAVKLLLERINGINNKPKYIQLDPQLMIRNSVKKIMELSDRRQEDEAKIPY
jgi:LacI family transcriptional regulator